MKGTGGDKKENKEINEDLETGCEKKRNKGTNKSEADS
jgi:hypothetical protein